LAKSSDCKSEGVTRPVKKNYRKIFFAAFSVFALRTLRLEAFARGNPSLRLCALKHLTAKIAKDYRKDREDLQKESSDDF